MSELLSDKVKEQNHMNVCERGGHVWVKLPVVTETIVSFKPPKIMQTEDGYAVCFSDSRICEEAISRYAEQIDKKVLRAICEAMGYVPQRTCRIVGICEEMNVVPTDNRIAAYSCKHYGRELAKYCSRCGAKLVDE